MSFLRRISWLPFVAFASLTLTACSGVGYLAENGMEQWKMFNRARPVKEVLASPRTPEMARRAIMLVGEVKSFAVGELGLLATKNYETYVALDGPCVVWAVSAAHPVELIEKKWKFPIVGEIPYLGFFRKESADREAARLRATEQPMPDTWVRCVPAFSSLGWFADPLYSSMLKGRDRDIADLVIHESLHATVWVGSNVDFNEKLASFVGLEGSLRFVEKKSGAAGLEKARQEVAGEKLFAEFLQMAIARYRATVKDLAGKEAFYRGLPASYEAFLSGRRRAGVKFVTMPVKLETWNNAALVQFANYYSDYSVFERMLAKCGGDLGRFVSWIAGEQKKDKARFKSAPEQALVELVGGSSCP
jgi:predicted aminopeptidase